MEGEYHLLARSRFEIDQPEVMAEMRGFNIGSMGGFRRIYTIRANFNIVIPQQVGRVLLHNIKPDFMKFTDALIHIVQVVLKQISIAYHIGQIVREYLILHVVLQNVIQGARNVHRIVDGQRFLINIIHVIHNVRFAQRKQPIISCDRFLCNRAGCRIIGDDHRDGNGQNGSRKQQQHQFFTNRMKWLDRLLHSLAPLFRSYNSCIHSNR
ncbi:hypothetical protein D3C78_865690 [compost metagenome]